MVEQDIDLSMISRRQGGSCQSTHSTLYPGASSDGYTALLQQELAGRSKVLTYRDTCDYFTSSP